MRPSSWKAIVGILFTAFTYGCGGSGNPTGNPGVTGPATDVTVTFTQEIGPNSPVTLQAGTGAFQTVTLQGNKLTFTVPAGPQKYILVYSCTPEGGLAQNHGNTTYVVEATTQDGTAYTVSCLDPPQIGTVTGTVDATQIPGATGVEFLGTLNTFGSVPAPVFGPFQEEGLATGTADVAVVAANSQGPLALKILRAQTVPGQLAPPGTLNGGNPIVFTSADEYVAAPLPLAVNNPLGISISYVTATGTQAFISSNATSYQPVPASAVQPGDFYLFWSNTVGPSPNMIFRPIFGRGVGVYKTVPAAGPVSLSLPSPLSFPPPVFSSGPFPTFTFNFTGFNGQPAVSQQAQVAWGIGGNSADSVSVTATASFQNGASTINVNIPELVTLGIVRPPASGTPVNWFARVSGGSVHNFAFVPEAPGNGGLSNVTLSFVQDTGFYTQP